MRTQPENNPKPKRLQLRRAFYEMLPQLDPWSRCGSFRSVDYTKRPVETHRRNLAGIERKLRGDNQ